MGMSGPFATAKPELGRGESVFRLRSRLFCPLYKSRDVFVSAKSFTAPTQTMGRYMCIIPVAAALLFSSLTCVSNSRICCWAFAA